MSQLSEDCFPMFGLLGTSLKMRFRIERGSKQKNALTASGLTCFSLFMLLKAQISLLWKKKKKKNQHLQSSSWILCKQHSRSERKVGFKSSYNCSTCLAQEPKKKKRKEIFFLHHQKNTFFVPFSVGQHKQI